MRPAILNPLFASIQKLPGIGPKLLKLYESLLDRAEPRVIDLLFHLPYSAIDRRARPKLAEVVPDTIATVEVTIDRHQPGRGRAPYRIFAEDDTGTLEIVYFNIPADRLEKMLPLGEKRWVSGKIALYDGRLQMVHPDRVLDEKGLANLPDLDPVYSLTEGLAAGNVRRAAAAALKFVPEVPEWDDPAFRAQHGFASFAEAVKRLHIPAELSDIAPELKFRARLAYDELLAHQLSLALVRGEMRREPGRASKGDGRLRAKIEAALPFSLTSSQRKAIEEIVGDLASETRMLRLLQGDVGSGKTIVALLGGRARDRGRPSGGDHGADRNPRAAAFRAHFAARQGGGHHARDPHRPRTGRRARRVARCACTLEESISLVGTHALFQEGVEFRDLALAVVDEQHRFGVHQRLALARKGGAVDMLVMTATPIPRTLVITYFGDMEVSELREKPAGRTPIDTRTISLERSGEVVEAVGRALASGARAYWICPLIEESEEVDFAAAEARYETLKAEFGEIVGLVHGRMKGAERDEAMARFARGEIKLLVATTVIEVGVDVPEATIMVVEQAERFGLAQLHQLRGRVGRGTQRSTCLLLYRAPLGEAAKRRLAKLRETDDGFEIAEEDLALRGEGEVLGTRQSGLPGFRIARPELHRDLMEAARKDAALILQRDSALTSERGKALRLLLHLFEREEAARLLEAG